MIYNTEKYINGFIFPSIKMGEIKFIGNVSKMGENKMIRLPNSVSEFVEVGSKMLCTTISSTISQS